MSHSTADGNSDQKSNSTPTFATLPPELIFTTLDHLSWYDRMATYRVSKELRKLTKQYISSLQVMWSISEDTVVASPRASPPAFDKSPKTVHLIIHPDAFGAGYRLRSALEEVETRLPLGTASHHPLRAVHMAFLPDDRPSRERAGWLSQATRLASHFDTDLWVIDGSYPDQAFTSSLRSGRMLSISASHLPKTVVEVLPSVSLPDRSGSPLPGDKDTPSHSAVLGHISSKFPRVSSLVLVNRSSKQPDIDASDLDIATLLTFTQLHNQSITYAFDQILGPRDAEMTKVTLSQLLENKLRVPFYDVDDLVKRLTVLALDGPRDVAAFVSDLQDDVAGYLRSVQRFSNDDQIRL